MVGHADPKLKSGGKQRELRAKCRARWGNQWHSVHPVIKKCRLAWASGTVDPGQMVLVREGGSSYAV
jgi:hypothetical protein